MARDKDKEVVTENVNRLVGTMNIALQDLLPHPLNANRMDPDLFEKLKVHMRKNGRYPHVIVRVHPTEEGKYQILDGHHRVRVLEDLQHPHARCDVWDVNDREAQIYMATLNRLQGDDLPIRRASLLHELLKEFSMGDLAGLLPETETQLEELHNLLEFPAGDIAEQLAATDEKDAQTTPVVLTFIVMPEMVPVIEEAVEQASDGTPGRDRKAKGLFNISKAFLDAMAPQADA